MAELESVNFAGNVSEIENTKNKISSITPDVTDKQYPSAKALLDFVYPIGCLYWSSKEDTPDTLFGGTWKRVKDTFILAAGDTYTAGSTGGKSKVVLTENQMPVHSHNISYCGNSSTTTETYRFEIVESTHGGYIKTETSGGGLAHENMPPYKVYYCWERTA